VEAGDYGIVERCLVGQRILSVIIVVAGVSEVVERGFCPFAASAGTDRDCHQQHVGYEKFSYHVFSR